MLLADIEKLITLVQAQSNPTVDFCLTKLRLLLAIHEEPGLGAADYGRRCNLPDSSSSRHMRELKTGKSGNKRPMVGLGFIEAHPASDDWRKLEIRLSAKGKLLIEQLLALGANPT